MTEPGRRERKKAATREHLSTVAAKLFAKHGFDAVSVSEIAEAADVARPTVFAHFPRKEDLAFDRTATVTDALVQAVRDSEEPPLRALRDVLARPTAPGGFGATVSQQLPFWRLVAGSRVLQARARELAEEMEESLARALASRGVPDASLVAALVAAAYRTVHLHAIRRVLAGEPAHEVESERTARLSHAFDAIERAVAALPPEA